MAPSHRPGRVKEAFPSFFGVSSAPSRFSPCILANCGEFYLNRIQELDEDNSGHVHENAEQNTGTTGNENTLINKGEHSS